MELFDVNGTRAVWTPQDEEAARAFLATLSSRQQRLVVGAANYHALRAPGARVRVNVHLGSETETPRLTSPAHADIMAHPFLGSVVVESASDGSGVEFSTEVDAYVLLTPDSATNESGAPSLSAYWKLRQAVERRYPLQYDLLRQKLLSSREHTLQSQAIVQRGLRDDESELFPIVGADGRQPAVLIGIHWFDLGGAERWAIETVKLAREAGFLPIVISDRSSQQPWITRPEFDGAVLVPLTFPLDDDLLEDAFLHGILERFDVRGVIVHHCAWLYDRLPRITKWVPTVKVIDSLHIIEYAGGGYPASGVRLSPFIDIHHVISPQLAEWLEGPQEIDPDKVALAPLVGLTSTQTTFEFRERAATPFTIGFIGRFVRQKRPYLFLKLMRRLHNDGLPVRAIMHGGGELDEAVRREINKYGLDGIVEIRNHDQPVEQTLDNIDLLVISSQNEGITLTTFEALAAGVPVLSANVGSQDTVIPAEMLIPRAPRGFVEEAATTITRLAAEPAARRSAWNKEIALAREFSAQESATEWMRRTLKSWTK